MTVPAEPEDVALLDALRSGDERAFAQLIDSHDRGLLRVTRSPRDTISSFRRSPLPQQWAAPPPAWPHERILARETIEQLRIAIHRLPPAQQIIVGLRDIDGWSTEEVCAALDITPGNQRVLLHRARSRLRHALEDYFDTP